MPEFGRVGREKGEGLTLEALLGEVADFEKKFGAARDLHVPNGVLGACLRADALFPGFQGYRYLPDDEDDKFAIVEKALVRTEHIRLEAWLSGLFVQLTNGKGRALDKIKRACGGKGGFDLWPVRDGFISQESALGVDLRDFTHAGVFCPSVMAAVCAGDSCVATHAIPVVDAVVAARTSSSQFGAGVASVTPAGERLGKYVGVGYTGVVMVFDGCALGVDDPVVSLDPRFECKGVTQFAFPVLSDYPCDKGSFASRFKLGDIVVVRDVVAADVCRELLREHHGLSGVSVDGSVIVVDDVLVEISKVREGSVSGASHLGSLHFFGWRVFDPDDIYRVACFLGSHHAYLHDMSVREILAVSTAGGITFVYKRIPLGAKDSVSVGKSAQVVCAEGDVSFQGLPVGAGSDFHGQELVSEFPAAVASTIRSAGYCYLRMIKTEYVTAASSALGLYPIWEDVVGWLSRCDGAIGDLDSLGVWLRGGGVLHVSRAGEPVVGQFLMTCGEAFSHTRTAFGIGGFPSSLLSGLSGERFAGNLAAVEDLPVLGLRVGGVGVDEGFPEVKEVASGEKLVADLSLRDLLDRHRIVGSKLVDYFAAEGYSFVCEIPEDVPLVKALSSVQISPLSCGQVVSERRTFEKVVFFGAGRGHVSAIGMRMFATEVFVHLVSVNLIGPRLWRLARD